MDICYLICGVTFVILSGFCLMCLSRGDIHGCQILQGLTDSEWRTDSGCQGQGPPFMVYGRIGLSPSPSLSGECGAVSTAQEWEWELLGDWDKDWDWDGDDSYSSVYAYDNWVMLGYQSSLQHEIFRFIRLSLVHVLTSIPTFPPVATFLDYVLTKTVNN